MLKTLHYNILLNVGAAGELVILQVESSVHVVNAAGDLVLVRDHSEEEWAGVGYDWLPQVSNPQCIPTEPVCAVMGFIIFAMATRQ